MTDEQGEMMVAEPAAAIVPPWLANLASLAWRLVAVTALVAVLWLLATLLSTVTAALAVAIVVAAVLVPATRRLRARGRSRSAAAAIVWATSMLVVTGVLVVLAVAFLPHLVAMLTATEAGVADLEARLAAIQLPPFATAIVGLVVDAARAILRDAAGAVASSAAGVVTSLVLATFLVFFFLRDGDRAWAWCLQAVSEDKRGRIGEAGEDALGRVGGYLIGTTLLSALIAGTDLVFMLLLGVPAAVPLALLVFLAGYIPYFGGILTTLLVLVVTLGALGPTAAIVLLGLIAIRNMFVGYAVRPTVYGRSVSLHPALVLIALPAGYEVAGIVGLFAAVPVTAVVLAVAGSVAAVAQPDPAPELPGLVPAWLDRFAQWSWRILAALALVGLVVVLFVNLPLVLVPVVFGVILAATFAPLVDILRRRGLPRGAAIGIALGGSFLVITVMLLLAAGVLIQEGASIAAAAVDGANRVSETAEGQLQLLVQAVSTLGRGGVETLVSVVDEAAGMAVALVLSLLLCFYFLRDGARLWQRILAHAQPETVGEVEAAGARAFEVLGGYMYGTAVISLVGALSQFVIMVVLGIPLALPVFVLSFFLCFIPYIGGFLSTGAALLLTISTGSPVDIAVMAVWTLVFNIVTGNIVGPVVYGRTVHLHPAIVLIAIPIGSAIAGILGMLLVVPILGVVAVSWRTVLHVMAAAPAEPPAEVPPTSPEPASAVVPA